MRNENQFLTDIDNYESPNIIIPNGNGTNSYPTMPLEDFPFNVHGYNEFIFDESVKYRLTIHHVNIRFSLQKYVQNDCLMIRVVFKIKINTFGSATGVNLKMKITDYEFVGGNV